MPEEPTKTYNRDSSSEELKQYLITEMSLTNYDDAILHKLSEAITKWFDQQLDELLIDKGPSA